MDLLVGTLLDAGARAAGPGEFTMRAFLAGKKDLTQAEAVLAVIEAGTDDELKQALAQLAGGMTQPLHGLRDDLLNLLADVEAGLDFTEEDIQFADKRDVLLRLGAGLAHLTQPAQAARRPGGQRPAVPGGPGRASRTPARAACSTPWPGCRPPSSARSPGTTRDYVTRLGDAPGDERRADRHGRLAGGERHDRGAGPAPRPRAGGRADLVLWCVPGRRVASRAA